MNVSKHRPVAPSKPSKRARSGTAAQQTLRIEYLPLSDLLQRTAARNPKGHDLGLLHASYGRFGQVDVPVLNETTGRLVAGHGRLLTLQQKKAAGEPPPLRILLREDKDWGVPVLRGVRFSTDAEAEAYLIASNQTVIAGGWEDRDLSLLLTDLARADSLDGTGFDGEDVDALLARVNAPVESDSDQCTCPLCGLTHLKPEGA